MATFTCFISIYEGFGFPISESLWHGIPVLTSNFGSMEEIAICGGCYSINTNNGTNAKGVPEGTKYAKKCNL